MTRVHRITRRQALKVTAGAVGTTLPLVHVQTAAAAGKLTMGIWDHWVPAANPVLRGLVDEWAAKNKVDVTIDFIPSAGNKMILTQAAEAQAGSGHDILAFDQWNAQQHGNKLTPVNDVMAGLINQYGPVSKAVEYLGKSDGKWLGVPVAWGSAPLPPCARISMIKNFTGEDVTEWYPAKRREDQRCGRVDVRQAAEDGRAVSQGGPRVRAWLRSQQHGREPDLGRDVRGVRGASGGWQGQHHRRF